MSIQRDGFNRYCGRSLSIKLIGVLAISVMTAITSQAQQIKTKKKGEIKPIIKPLVLWVNQGSTASEILSDSYAGKTLPKELSFQWAHNLEEARWVGFEIYEADKILMSSHGQPLITGKGTERMKKHKFSLDRSHFNNLNSSVIKVRLAVYAANPWLSSDRLSVVPKLLARSEPVTLTFTEATIDEFSTEPELNALKPGGKLIIKGALFGTKPGHVLLTFNQPKKQVHRLNVTKWEPDTIQGEIPASIEGFIDHDDSGFMVRTDFGLESAFQTVKVKAKRHTLQLRYNDPIIKLNCSRGTDKNLCNDYDANTGGNCSGPGQLYKNPGGGSTPATITVFHQNCDASDDLDEGADTFIITLQNGWVFRKFERFANTSNNSELLDMPDADSLKESVGKDLLELYVRWRIGPAPNYVQYGYRIWITGPMGVPYWKND